MPTNQTVTYVDLTFNSAAAYWDGLVLPNVADYRSTGVPRFALQAATYTWHLHDWVWHEQNPGVNSRGPQYTQFQSGLLSACPELGWLRDMTDASKHCGLGRVPEVAEAKARVVHYASLPLVLNNYPVEELILIMSDGSEKIFNDVLTTALDYWSNTQGFPAPPNQPRPRAGP